MFIKLGQDDSHYLAASIACAVLLFIFIITAKSLDKELRNPFVAFTVAALAGIVIFISKAIPMFVIGILSLGCLVAMIRNLTQPHKASHHDVHSSDSDTKIQSTKKINQPSLIPIESLKSLWPIASIFMVMGFFCFIYLLFNKNEFMNLMGSMHSTSPAINTMHSDALVAPVKASMVKADVQHTTALRSYQQAKIDHQNAIHAVDEAWANLSRSVLKRDIGIWLKGQQTWVSSKRHVCGSIDDVQDIHVSTAIELDLKTKALRCDTDANLNRASYLRSSVEAINKGHQPADDIGNLIQNLNR